MAVQGDTWEYRRLHGSTGINESTGGTKQYLGIHGSTGETSEYRGIHRSTGGCMGLQTYICD